MDTRMTKRRNFSDKFKAAVALEALRGDKTVQEIAASLRSSFEVRAWPILLKNSKFPPPYFFANIHCIGQVETMCPA